MPKIEKTSTRRCLITREILEKSEMIRFVVGPDNTIVPDIDNRLPGRGLWLSLEYNVIKEASSGSSFAKAARKKVSAPVELPQMIEKLLVRRCVNFLGLAHKAGLVTTGFEKVKGAVKKDKIQVLIVAHDAADNGLEKIVRLASGKKIIETLSALDLSQGLGKERAVYVALAKSTLTDKIVQENARLEKYRETIKTI